MKQTTKWLAAALIALGLNQAVWADNIPDFRETLQAAEQGNAQAQLNLGLMYVNGQGVRQDYTQAAQWYRRAAEQGVAQAQYALGVMYENGQGVHQDYTQAVQWYRRAAEQGDANAQYTLGVMYAQGQGVRQDDAQA
ncbi:tetratricopeptide repeat protein, partial [uncultured Neisseria sp.]|uniref:tetratricopeptide repeat protein n=1 Tax=uncultured Neisseria sp. TaxID=237778 RepID=UPI0025D12310